MVEMEKRRRLKGVLIKTEPCDIGITSADSSEEMEMNDNGHVSEDEYSEMTYDDMNDFEPLKLHVKGEHTCELEITSGVDSFVKNGSTSNSAIDESNATTDTTSSNANFETDIHVCNINQIDDIQFKAMDALSQLDPGVDKGILTEKQFDDILKSTDDMFSDIEAFAAFTDNNNENDTSLSSEGLPAVDNETNNDSDSIHSKESENNINTKDCTARDQNSANDNDLCLIKGEKVVDKTLIDKDPIKSGDAKSETSYRVDRKSLSVHEMDLNTVKQEKITYTCNSVVDGHSKQINSVKQEKPSYERDQDAKEDRTRPVGSTEGSDLGNKNDKSFLKDCANAASEASNKRRRYDSSWLHQGLHSYLSISDKQQANGAGSNIQSLCDTFGVPSSQEQAPTAANYVHNKSNLVNMESHNDRPLINAIKKLNRSGIYQNLPLFPGVSNQYSIRNKSESYNQFPASRLIMQGARPQGQGVFRGTLNQSRPQGLGVNRGTLNQSRLNQSVNGHYRTPNRNGNPLWSDSQMHQNNVHVPFSGNNPQRPEIRTALFQGQRDNNNGNCVNDLDFRQSLDDFDIDLLGYSQATPSGSFKNDSSASYRLLNRQPRDIFSNKPKNVNSGPSDMCHRSINQHIPHNPVIGHSTNSVHPIKSCPADLPGPYPHGHGQSTYPNPQFRNRTVSSETTCSQPSAIIHHSPSKNMHSSPKSIQPFTPPGHQIRQHNFSGTMNNSNTQNNLFWKS